MYGFSFILVFQSKIQ